MMRRMANMKRTKIWTMGYLMLLSALLLTTSAYASSIPPCPLPPNGESHLFIYPLQAISPTGANPADFKSPGIYPSNLDYGYIAGSNDPWLQDSWFKIGSAPLSLAIANRDKVAGDWHTVDSVVLIVAIPGDATVEDLNSITISGGDENNGADVIIPFSEFGYAENNPFVGSGSHGVYQPSGSAKYAFYFVGQVPGGGIRNLSASATGKDNPNFYIHFDAYDCTTGLKNAFSSDLTWRDPGNQASCLLSMICPAAQTLQCQNGGAIYDFPLPFITDTCDSSHETLTSDEASSYPYNACQSTMTPVTFTLAIPEKSTSCTTGMTVVDTLPPQLTCPPAQILEANDSCQAKADISGALASDACQGDIAVSCAESLFGLGVGSLSCSATDCSGNSSSCTSEITVKDTTPPSIECPVITPQECTGPCNTPVSLVASVKDNCGIASNTCVPGSGNYCLGTTSNTCIAVDNSNNSAECQTIVTIKDSIAPQISCSASSSISTSEQAGLCTATLLVSASANDTCEGSLTPKCELSQLTLGAPGNDHTVCSVLDSSGNSAACGVSLALIDDTPPTLQCPGAKTIFADESCHAIEQITAQAADNCDRNLTSSCDPVSLEFFQPGTLSTSCQTQDNAGNVASCNTTVTLEDQMPPKVTCPAPITVYADENCEASASLSATAQDNCSGILDATCDPAAINFSKPETVPATCSAVDGAGNPGSCDTSVTMKDQIAPDLEFGTMTGIPGSSGGFCNDSPVKIPFTVKDNCACDAFTVTATSGILVFDQNSKSGYVELDLTNSFGAVSLTLSVTDCFGNNESFSTFVVSQTCFCTYTQGGWGADSCKGGNPACILKNNFATIYPTGLNVGSTNSLQFSTNIAVATYLPRGETPGRLNAGTFINPTGNHGEGVLGGQLTALHINVNFDDEGVLASIDPNLALGDLKIAAGPFKGKTVAMFLEEAEAFMGGSSALPSGITWSSLNDTADRINNNFDGCKASKGFLVRP